MLVIRLMRGKHSCLIMHPLSDGRGNLLILVRIRKGIYHGGPVRPIVTARRTTLRWRQIIISQLANSGVCSIWAVKIENDANIARHTRERERETEHWPRRDARNKATDIKGDNKKSAGRRVRASDGTASSHKYY